MNGSKRAGFGVAAGIVLAVIGIALLLVLGAGSLGSASRTTFQRAIFAARATSVCQEAIDEVSYAQDNRDRIMGSIVRAVDPKNADPTDTSGINGFFFEISPTRPNARSWNPTGDLATNYVFPNKPGMYYIQGPANTVVFGIGNEPAYSPDAVRAAHQSEIKAGILEISDVRIRPVTYTYLGEDSDGKDYPYPDSFGIARAQVTVKYHVAKSPVIRTMTVDHKFDLSTVSRKTAAGQKVVWELHVHEVTAQEVVDGTSIF
jgi:type II secretory pathway pseudopilin PulG